jgi:integrase
MYLLIKPSGSKHWHMDYRLNEKRLTASFGPYPEVSLADAREKRSEARRRIVAGIQPTKHKRAARQAVLAVAANTFESIAWEWYELKIKPKSEVHQSRTRANLEKDPLPYLGKLPLGLIEASDLLVCLRRMQSRTDNRGNPITESTPRVHAQASDIWRYAISTGRAKHDIAADLIGALQPHVSMRYTHIKDPAILSKLIIDIRGYGGSIVTKAALSLLPLLWSRPGKLRQAKWSEIDLDGKQWRYVATKTKTDHIVPLSDQAVAILRERQPFSGASEYVFAGRADDKPFAPNTLNQALKYLGYPNDIIQPHVFRHTPTTMLAKRGWRPKEIERQLSHKTPDMPGVYQKVQYLESRTRMMQDWSHYLDEIAPQTSLEPVTAV